MTVEVLVNKQDPYTPSKDLNIEDVKEIATETLQSIPIEHYSINRPKVTECKYIHSNSRPTQGYKHAFLVTITSPKIYNRKETSSLLDKMH